MNYSGLSIFIPINPNPMFNWFNDDLGDAFNCQDQKVCGNKEDISNSVGVLEIMIASDTYNPVDFPDESKWMARVFLFQKLMREPSVLNNPDILAFYYSNMNGNIDKINQIKSLTKDLDTKSFSDSSFLALTDSLIQINMSAIENCEKSFSQGLFLINSIMLRFQVLNR